MKKKLRNFTVVLVLFAIGMALYANTVVPNAAKGKTYNTPRNLPKNKVGMVLGTSKFLKNGQINLYFQYRIDATLALFEAGKIQFVLVSGDNGSKNYDEPTAFKNALMQRGIPGDKIFLDFAGFRTLDSVVRASKVFGQQKFTVISQKFHNERSIYLGKQFDLEIVGFNAKDVKNFGGIRTKIREYFARTKAVLDIVFGVAPKFLGEKIEIK